jgi:hypothetical protein
MAWTHLDDTLVKKARKPHRCYLCGVEIPKGASYLRRTGVDEDSGLVSVAMHPVCELQTQHWDEMDWETFSPGDLWFLSGESITAKGFEVL